MLAVEVQTEAEKAIVALLNQELKQGTSSIQKQNVAFNRLVQKLQGETAQSQYTLMLLYRNSLSDLYAKHAHYDASGSRFSTLADMQQHLLKQEGMIKKKERDVSLFKQMTRNRFQGEKKKKIFLAKGTSDSPRTPHQPPTLAAVQGQEEAKEQMRGEVAEEGETLN